MSFYELISLPGNYIYGPPSPSKKKKRPINLRFFSSFYVTVYILAVYYVPSWRGRRRFFLNDMKSNQQKLTKNRWYDSYWVLF